jgi:hypothetical protein
MRIPNTIHLLYLLLGSCWLIPAADAQEAKQRKLLVGDAFSRQLEAQFGLDWSSIPLRQKLNELSEHTQVAVWLDRRIDPSQHPELSIPDSPLSRCFELIGQKIHAGVCYVGPVAYFGPPSVTAKLATLAELRNLEAAELPAESRTRMTRLQTWSWEPLTTPQELLAQLAREGKVTFVGADKIPHDLWAPVELPALSFTDRLTLVLAGFDLTFEFDKTGKNVRFVPFPDKPTLVRKYTIRGDVDEALTKLQAAVPQASFKRQGPSLVATGRSEEQQLIAQLLSGEKARVPAVGPARKVYTMKGPSVLGTVLKTLQVRAGLNISLDAKAQTKLKDLVHFDVKDASMEELLSTVLRDTGLQFELNGQDLRVFSP